MLLAGGGLERENEVKTVTSPAKPRVLSCFVAVVLASLAGSAGADLGVGSTPASLTTFSDGRFDFVHSYDFQPSFSAPSQFSGSARSTWTAKIANDADVAQSYQFSFDVEEGEIGIYGKSSFFAQLEFDIRRNGESVSRNKTSVDGKKCLKVSEGALSDATDCVDPYNAKVVGQRLSIDLGSLASGDSFTLEYELIASVSGPSWNACSLDVNPSGDTLGFLVSNTRNALTTLGNACGGWALVRSGDLLPPGTYPKIIGADTTESVGDTPGQVASFTQVDAVPLPFLQLQSSTSIPEPGTLALAGAALMGLAGWRLRRGSDGLARWRVARG